MEEIVGVEVKNSVKKAEKEKALMEKRTIIDSNFIEKHGDENETEYEYFSKVNTDGSVTVKVIPKVNETIAKNDTIFSEARILLEEKYLYLCVFLGILLTILTENLFIFIAFAFLCSSILYLNGKINPPTKLKGVGQPPYNDNYPFMTFILSEYNYNKFKNGQLKNRAYSTNYARSIDEVNHYKDNSYPSLYESSLGSIVNNSEDIIIDEDAFKNYKKDCHDFINGLGKYSREEKLKKSDERKALKRAKAKEKNSEFPQRINEEEPKKDNSAYSTPKENIQYIKENGGPTLFNSLEKLYDRLNEEERRDYTVCSNEWRAVHEASMVITNGPLVDEQVKVLNNVTNRIEEVLGQILYKVNERTLNDMKIREIFLNDKYNNK